MDPTRSFLAAQQVERTHIPFQVILSPGDQEALNVIPICTGERPELVRLELSGLEPTNVIKKT